MTVAQDFFFTLLSNSDGRRPPLQSTKAAPGNRGGFLVFSFPYLPHSTFCTCSRIFSSSVLASTTVWAMPASLALEPMVLNSRNNSWQRKSSGRPQGVDFRATSGIHGSARRHRSASKYLTGNPHFGIMKLLLFCLAVLTVCSGSIHTDTFHFIAVSELAF